MTNNIKANRDKPRGGEPFALLPLRVINSKAFKTLSGPAVKCLVYVAVQYRPNRNGDISLPFSRFKDYGFGSNNTMQSGIAQLLERGLLIKTRRGKQIFSHPTPNLYALAWLPISPNDKFDEPYSNGRKEDDHWAKWQPSEAPTK